MHITKQLLYRYMRRDLSGKRSKLGRRWMGSIQTSLVPAYLTPYLGYQVRPPTGYLKQAPCPRSLFNFINIIHYKDRFVLYQHTT